MEEIFNTEHNPSEPTIIKGKTFISYDNAKEIFEKIGDTEAEYYVLVIDGDMMFHIDHATKILYDLPGNKLYTKTDLKRVKWYPLHSLEKLNKKIIELEEGISEYKSHISGIYSVKDRVNNVCYTQLAHQFWGIDAPRILEILKTIKEKPTV